MSKTLDTVVDDIYTLMQTKKAGAGVDIEKEIQLFADNMKDLMSKEFLPNKRVWDGRNLRLSSIGKPDLQQWYKAKRFQGEKLQPHNFIKFMYGHMIEEMILFMVRMSGHEVTHEQAVAEVGGIKGHMDCKIDGTLVDVKSTSAFGFNKFKDGSIAASDAFGYIDQLKAYAHSEGESTYGWLAMDKSNGHLCTLVVDETNTDDPMNEFYNHDIEARVEHVKKVVEQKDKPDMCQGKDYGLTPDGKSGNMKLKVGCSYCGYKKHCYPNLRVFTYSTGPKFLAEVRKTPNVPEEF